MQAGALSLQNANDFLSGPVNSLALIVLEIRCIGLIWISRSKSRLGLGGDKFDTILRNTIFDCIRSSTAAACGLPLISQPSVDLTL